MHGVIMQERRGGGVGKEGEKEKENALVLAEVQPGTMSLCSYLNCDK